VARRWQIEDLPPCGGICGGSRRQALIDSRGKLTAAQVGEKLRAEIEWERSGAFSIGRCSITEMASSSAAADFDRGSIRPARRILNSGSIS
jgi:hypothetical protein